MNEKLKKLKREADPNCNLCHGKGYLVDKYRAEQLDPAKARQSGKTEMLMMGLLRLCPVCFDPEGNPRDDERVKK